MEDDIAQTCQDMLDLESLVIAGLDTEALGLIRDIRIRLAVY